MTERKVRIGIDVGGTHTKAVAIDNLTKEIIGKSSVKTTHDSESGVSGGVVAAFLKCLEEYEIAPESVVFVAHSTTQATNALLEGDVATVGVIGTGGNGIEGFLAKLQTKVKDIDLGTGRKIVVISRYIPGKEYTAAAVDQALAELRSEKVNVLVATSAFGVDDLTKEQEILAAAEKQGFSCTMASEMTKLYGLSRRTRTAVINGSILPKMLETANCTEESVREAGVDVPLMIMRGDGGVMDVGEMKKRPVLTMLSGPAASVMGSLMYLRASNGIYFEVGGTSTNIGVIKDGRPAIDYSQIGGRNTYISSLDVRVLGVAGGSMVRVEQHKLLDIGPRSAHIGGMDYAAFTPLEEIEEPTLEFFSPKEGDPKDYAAIRLKNGKRITITTTDAANVLGLIQPEHFSYGNQESIRKAMQPLADYVNKTIEEMAEELLALAFAKIRPVILSLAEKYKLEKDQMSLVGVGGGAASLIIYTAEKLGLNYQIPENAEVISSIGVALAMVQDVVERMIPNPTREDINAIKREAADKAIENGATEDSIEVHIDIDPQTQKITAIATGSTEVQTTELLSACTEEEAHEIAGTDLRVGDEQLQLVEQSEHFYVFSAKIKSGDAVRVIDRKGFIRMQRGHAKTIKTPMSNYMDAISFLWEEMANYKSDLIIRPDFYICAGPRMMDFSSNDFSQLMMLIEVEMADFQSNEDVLIIAANQSY
ncbi:hydantoinase/oxoprolinase family protein [Enterococcus sp. CWB-B31]|uniref:hydantoinase/oxoprolinase family protein n=1 Tax=Enterococcus sp. CWB-B31 TaxID=2885159 RepID=UPI001E3FE01F|nr:hydantoinase/oxoprolinase family protein [Enterococcus sp. CWB-B31]MCB5953461.1 hydantoinase/oxoprolinase family protein [Enterococcus sp. CWB-B31]